VQSKRGEEFVPVVSVALITYNHEKYIRQALDSTLSQVVDFEYEIVVGEDYSVDRTREILEEYAQKYPKRFVLIFRPSNIGATKNLFDTLTHCSGRYIATLEGDDFWNNPYKLRKQVDFLDKNKEFIGIAHKHNTCNEEGRVISNTKVRGSFVNAAFSIDDYFRLRRWGFHSSTIMFRNIFINSGETYRDVITSHSLVGDRPLFIVLLDKGDIFVADFIGSTFRKVRDPKKGKNAQSIGIRYPLKSAVELYKQTEIIEQHFNGKYDFNGDKTVYLAWIWLWFLAPKRTICDERIQALQVIRRAGLKVNLRAIKHLLLHGFKRTVSGVLGK